MALLGGIAIAAGVILLGSIIGPVETLSKEVEDKKKDIKRYFLRKGIYPSDTELTRMAKKIAYNMYGGLTLDQLLVKVREDLSRESANEFNKAQEEMNKKSESKKPFWKK